MNMAIPASSGYARRVLLFLYVAAYVFAAVIITLILGSISLPLAGAFVGVLVFREFIR
jgi:hypothetical protein